MRQQRTHTQQPHADALQQYLLDRASLLTKRSDLDRGELFDAAYGLDAAIRSDRMHSSKTRWKASAATC